MVKRKKKHGMNKEDTTMKKNIFALAALLMASATVFTACSSDDNIISEQQPEQGVKTYTMTVQASKGDGATTRALSLSGSTLNAMWAEGEAVTVYNVTKSTDLTGTLIAQGSGASTTLKGELSGTIAENDVLTLKFLSPDYNTQDGTLTGSATSIDKVCDYAEATVTMASVAGGNITTTGDADFQNKQSFVKFTLKDKSTDAAISATQLVVNDGTSDYTVTPASATDVLYVALPDISSKTLTLTATVGSDTYTYEKAGVTFQNGQYYEITVKAKRQGVTINLSTVTGNTTAKDGDVLTGTLGTNVKISIAAGATVTLQGADINGSGTWNSGSYAGINCVGDATIILDGTNTVRGFYENYPGIHVPTGSTLTIQGDGSLTASSNGYGADICYGAGIGGGYRLQCGNIVIVGGTVTATGAYGAAGIGSGQEASCGDITISGGTVTATGGSFAAGIGSGYNGSCGSIEITSSVTSVTATKGDYAPNSIGAGNIGSCGTVTIGGTVGAISKSPYTYDPSAPIIRTLVEATAEDLGKIVDADGNIYDTKAAATAAGTTAVAMIAYVGSETDHATYKHGYAIALSDESSSNWSTAKSTCEGKTAVTGAAWVLPSLNQWKAMFKANGGNEGSYSGLNNALATAGGDSSKLQEIDLYWSSSESDGGQAWPVNLLRDGDATWYGVPKDRDLLVRACLAF